jgi:hypothetical protein
MNQGTSFSVSITNIIDIYSLRSFTVHGFRYLQVSGAPNPLTVDDVECPVVHSETTVKGHFASSNPIINQIQHNIQWGQLGNIMSVPTDWYIFFIHFINLKCSLFFFILVHNAMLPG